MVRIWDIGLNLLGLNLGVECFGNFTVWIGWGRYLSRFIDIVIMGTSEDMLGV